MKLKLTSFVGRCCHGRIGHRQKLVAVIGVVAASYRGTRHRGAEESLSGRGLAFTLEDQLDLPVFEGLDLGAVAHVVLQVAGAVRHGVAIIAVAGTSSPC